MTLQRKTPLRPKKPMKRGKKPLRGYAVLGKNGSTDIPDTVINEDGSMSTTNPDLIEWMNKHPLVKKPCVTVEQMLSSGLLARGTTFTSKPKRLKPRAKKKPTGELALFKRLYAEQDGLCAVTGLPLHPPAHEDFHKQGSHILPKGAYPRARLWPDNVVMVLVEQHNLWEREKDKDKLVEIEPRWAEYAQRYFDMRLAYNTDDR